MSEHERGFMEPQPVEPKRRRLEGIADKTVDLTDSPDVAIRMSMDMKTFISRIGALQVGIPNQEGEIRKGWQVARTIERLEREDPTVSLEDLPTEFGIREKYIRLKNGENITE